MVALVHCLAASRISGPKVMLGTKRPSITSTWKRSTPAASASFMWAPRRVKSAARMEAEISTLVIMAAEDYAACSAHLQHGLQLLTILTTMSAVSLRRSMTGFDCRWRRRWCDRLNRSPGRNQRRRWQGRRRIGHHRARPLAKNHPIPGLGQKLDHAVIFLRQGQIFLEAHDGAHVTRGQESLRAIVGRTENGLDGRRHQHVRHQNGEVWDLLRMGLKHRHGIGRCGSLEAHGEKNDLTSGIVARYLQGIERGIHDAHVGAFGLDREEIATSADRQ